MDTVFGTRGFFAPEMLVPNAEFKQSVDVYALGVNLYMLLGTKPGLELEKMQTNKCYKYSMDDFTSPHDHGLKNLALQMLEHEPSRRPEIKDVLTKLEELKITCILTNEWELDLYSTGELLYTP